MNIFELVMQINLLLGKLLPRRNNTTAVVVKVTKDPDLGWLIWYRTQPSNPLQCVVAETDSTGCLAQLLKVQDAIKTIEPTLQVTAPTAIEKVGKKSVGRLDPPEGWRRIPGYEDYLMWYDCTDRVRSTLVDPQGRDMTLREYKFATVGVSLKSPVTGKNRVLYVNDLHRLTFPELYVSKEKENVSS